MNCFRPREKGSALFLILIAVAMFAALSYTVAQMFRVGSPNEISEQKADLLADGILSYAQTVRRAVQAVRINGCADTDISFSVTDNDVYEHTPDVSDKCEIFHSDGGGVSPQEEGLEGKSWFFVGGGRVYNLGTDGSTAANAELFMLLQIPQNNPVCTAINEKLGLPESINGSTFPSAWPASAKFAGSYFTGLPMGNLTVTEARGKTAACLYSSTAGRDSVFFQVLLAR